MCVDIVFTFKIDTCVLLTRNW